MTTPDNEPTTGAHAHAPGSNAQLPGWHGQAESAELARALAAEAPPPTRAFPRDWIIATLAALAAGLPIGWLLATAALLPFYLGLFFFALLGLLLGAVQYRVGLSAAPLPKSSVYAGGAVVILVTWLISMGVEFRHLSADATRFVKESQRRLGKEDLLKIEQETPARVRATLAAAYPPGGMIGYMRWAARSGRMQVGEQANGRPIEFRFRQSPLGFTLRVPICIALLAFGVMTQLLGLTRPPAPRPDPASGPKPAPG